MWPCAMSGVSEPVAVEVGEERLGLACVRVTVEHSSYKMASELGVVRLFSLRFSPPPTNWRNRNRNEKVLRWCLLFFSHTTYSFFSPTAAAAHGRAHTNTHTHSLFCTTRDTVARTHTATDGHTRVHPRATTYAANHTSTLWLNCRVQRHAVGITHVESSEEVIAHCH